MGTIVEVGVAVAMGASVEVGVSMAAAVALGAVATSDEDVVTGAAPPGVQAVSSKIKMMRIGENGNW